MLRGALSTNFSAKMKENISVPALATNGEILENGQVAACLPGENCGVMDSDKSSLKPNGSDDSRTCLTDVKLALKSSLEDTVSLNNCVVIKHDISSEKMISKQGGTCDSDMKSSDNLIEDPVDSTMENDIDEDFKLALSPETTGTDSILEDNQGIESASDEKQEIVTLCGEKQEVAMISSPSQDKPGNVEADESFRKVEDSQEIKKSDVNRVSGVHTAIVSENNIDSFERSSNKEGAISSHFMTNSNEQGEVILKEDANKDSESDMTVAVVKTDGSKLDVENNCVEVDISDKNIEIERPSTGDCKVADQVLSKLNSTSDKSTNLEYSEGATVKDEECKNLKNPVEGVVSLSEQTVAVNSISDVNILGNGDSSESGSRQGGTEIIATEALNLKDTISASTTCTVAHNLDKEALRENGKNEQAMKMDECTDKEPEKMEGIVENVVDEKLATEAPSKLDKLESTVDDTREKMDRALEEELLENMDDSLEKHPAVEMDSEMEEELLGNTDDIPEKKGCLKMDTSQKEEFCVNGAREEKKSVTLKDNLPEKMETELKEEALEEVKGELEEKKNCDISTRGEPEISDATPKKEEALDTGSVKDNVSSKTEVEDRKRLPSKEVGAPGVGSDVSGDTSSNVDKEVDLIELDGPCSKTGQSAKDSCNVSSVSGTAVIELKDVKSDAEMTNKTPPDTISTSGASNALQLNGISSLSISRDVQSTNLSEGVKKCSDLEKGSDMTLGRKRTHDPVDNESEIIEEKTKYPRTVNGFNTFDSSVRPSPWEPKEKTREPEILDKPISRDSVNTDDMCVAVAGALSTDDKKCKDDELVKPAETTKRKLSDPESLSDSKIEEKVPKSSGSASPCKPLDLSYLRKLHKGEVEKMSRNDLEELVVQKLCEAITERSEVGEMRLRCQALERGQEKWKEKYAQLQKQVRELNIVLRKFLSEQATATEKGVTVPVRITRSVGLQATLPGSAQRTLAALRLREKRERDAAVAASTGSTPPRAGPPLAVSASPSRRSQDCQAPQLSPAAQGVPPSPSNSVHQQTSPRQVMSASVSTCQPMNPAPLRPLPQTLPLTPPVRPQQTPPTHQNVAPALVQAQAPTQRPRANSGNLTVNRQQNQSHLQIQPRPSSLNTNPQIQQVVPQALIPPNASSQLNRLQVVLAPQQQQMLQQQQQQQLVLRQVPPPSKDVEIIDLDKDDRNRQQGRVSVSQNMQQIQTVSTSGAFPSGGNMTVRLVSNQQPGVPLTSQSHMTLLVPTSNAQQQKMIVSSAPPTVQLNNSTAKSRASTNALLKGVMQAMNSATVRQVQQGVVQPGALIPPRGLTIVQQPPQLQQSQPQMPQLQQLRPCAAPPSHPAPLPPTPTVNNDNPAWKMAPPKPSLKIQHTVTGIVLSWNMNLHPYHEDIDTYQLYAYQEGNTSPSSSLWKKVGDVKALPLPMACTLTQFAEGHRYHFAVRAMDIRRRAGPFSAPGNIRLEQKTTQ